MRYYEKIRNLIIFLLIGAIVFLLALQYKEDVRKRLEKENFPFINPTEAISGEQ